MPIGRGVQNKEGLLKILRHKLDQKDIALMYFLSQRVKLAIQIGQLKEEIGCKDDVRRVGGIFTKLDREADKMGLEKEKVRELWKMIMRMPWEG